MKNEKHSTLEELYYKAKAYVLNRKINIEISTNKYMKKIDL